MLAASSLVAPGSPVSEGSTVNLGAERKLNLEGPQQTTGHFTGEDRKPQRSGRGSSRASSFLTWY